VSLTPWKATATFPYWTFQFQMDGNSGPVDLTGVLASAFGCTIAGVDVNGNAVHRTGTGSFVALSQITNKGQVQYQESAADVLTPGRYQAEAFVTLTTGQLAISDNIEYEIVPRL
jgi:hypothetical protein